MVERPTNGSGSSRNGSTGAYDKRHGTERVYMRSALTAASIGLSLASSTIDTLWTSCMIGAPTAPLGTRDKRWILLGWCRACPSDLVSPGVCCCSDYHACNQAAVDATLHRERTASLSQMEAARVQVRACVQTRLQYCTHAVRPTRVPSHLCALPLHAGPHTRTAACQVRTSWYSLSMQAHAAWRGALQALPCVPCASRWGCDAVRHERQEQPHCGVVQSHSGGLLRTWVF